MNEKSQKELDDQVAQLFESLQGRAPSPPPDDSQNLSISRIFRLLVATLVTLALILAALRTLAPADPPCGEGTHALDGRCVSAIRCGESTVLVNGRCESFVQCGRGTVLLSGLCIAHEASGLGASPGDHPELDDPTDLGELLDEQAAPDHTLRLDEGQRGAPPHAAPRRLSRPEVLQTVQAGRQALLDCRSEARETGLLTVKFRIEPTGHVSDAQATGGDLKGGPLEPCMLRQVTLLRFPPFSGEPLSVSLPFRL